MKILKIIYNDYEQNYRKERKYAKKRRRWVTASYHRKKCGINVSEATRKPWNVSKIMNGSVDGKQAWIKQNKLKNYFKVI